MVTNSQKLPLTEPEIGQLAERLGRMLLRLPVLGGVVGHEWMQGTVKDYVQPDSLETEFLRDVVSRPIPEVLLKWYPRVTNGPYTLFMWPDLSPAGAPGPDEMAKAQHELQQAGKQPANYDQSEIDRLTQAVLPG